MRPLFALTFLIFNIAAAIGDTDTAASQAPSQDQLQFSNGDRLSGELIREDDTVIVFQSSVLGEITVSKLDAKVIVSDDSNDLPVEALVGIAPIPNAAQPAPEKPAKQQPSSGPSAAKPGQDAAKQAAKIAESLDKGNNPKEDWKGKLEFGLLQQPGRRDVFAVDVRGSADRDIGANELRAKARLLYGEQDGEVNNNRYDASIQWRREISERTFAQSLTSYFQDDLKDISRNWEQNFGAGYRLMDSKAHVVNLGAGLTGQYREASFAESGFFTLVEIFQDYTYRFNQRITLRQNAQAQYSPEGGTRFLSVSNQPSASTEEADNYKIRFNTVLQGKISPQLSMNLRFEYEYDNAVRPQSARTDQRIITSLGYAF